MSHLDVLPLIIRKLSSQVYQCSAVSESHINSRQRTYIEISEGNSTEYMSCTCFRLELTAGVGSCLWVVSGCQLVPCELRHWGASCRCLCHHRRVSCSHRTFISLFSISVVFTTHHHNCLKPHICWVINCRNKCFHSQNLKYYTIMKINIKCLKVR